ERRRRRAHGDADAERCEGVDAEMLEEPARDVSRRAEEGRLTEGEQARIAKQEIQAEPEDGEDPDLRAERVAHPQREETHRCEDCHGRTTHRTPTKPWGRPSNTTATTTKITAGDASVQ